MSATTEQKLKTDDVVAWLQVQDSDTRQRVIASALTAEVERAYAKAGSGEPSTRELSVRAAARELDRARTLVDTLYTDLRRRLAW